MSSASRAFYATGEPGSRADPARLCARRADIRKRRHGVRSSPLAVVRLRTDPRRLLWAARHVFAAPDGAFFCADARRVQRRVQAWRRLRLRADRRVRGPARHPARERGRRGPRGRARRAGAPTPADLCAGAAVVRGPLSSTPRADSARPRSRVVLPCATDRTVAGRRSRSPGPGAATARLDWARTGRASSRRTGGARRRAALGRRRGVTCTRPANDRARTRLTAPPRGHILTHAPRRPRPVRRPARLHLDARPAAQTAHDDAERAKAASTRSTPPARPVRPRRSESGRRAGRPVGARRAAEGHVTAWRRKAAPATFPSGPGRDARALHDRARSGVSPPTLHTGRKYPCGVVRTLSRPLWEDPSPTWAAGRSTTTAKWVSLSEPDGRSARDPRRARQTPGGVGCLFYDSGTPGITSAAEAPARGRPGASEATGVAPAIRGCATARERFRTPRQLAAQSAGRDRCAFARMRSVVGGGTCRSCRARGEHALVWRSVGGWRRRLLACGRPRATGVAAHEVQH